MARKEDRNYWLVNVHKVVDWQGSEGTERESGGTGRPQISSELVEKAEIYQLQSSERQSNERCCMAVALRLSEHIRFLFKVGDRSAVVVPGQWCSKRWQRQRKIVENSLPNQALDQ